MPAGITLAWVGIVWWLTRQHKSMVRDILKLIQAQDDGMQLQDKIVRDQEMRIRKLEDRQYKGKLS
jgi:hypothetical protein